MTDLTKIATAEPMTITDGISQQVAVLTTPPTSSAFGLVVRQAGPVNGQVATSNPAATSNGLPAPLMTDKVGRLAVVHNHVRDLVVTGAVDLTTTTETTILAAAGAGVFMDVVNIVISNDSSSPVNVLIRDTTGGAVKMTVALSRGGTTAGSTSAINIPFNTPFPQTTANSNWTVQLSTATSAVHCFFQAVKNI